LHPTSCSGPLGRSLLLFRASVLVGALVATVWAPSARAHDATFPVAGDSILIRTDQGAGTEVFQFEAAGPEVPLLDHDPRQDGTSIFVRGLGGSAGRSALATLDRNLWSPNSNGGYVYDDPAGSRGGITHVTMEAGLLSIQGAGANWGWSPAGSQDEVWVHMRIADTSFCSQFPSATTTSNAAGHFEALGAPEPAACPAQVCGDGVPQAPETCDDGNLATGDGCEATCETGPCNAQSFDSTFEAIQTVVFEGGYGCTDSTCHDSVSPKNELELTNAVAFEELLGPNGTGQPSHDYPSLKLVEPGEPELSYLFIKLAAKTYPDSQFTVDPGTGMPSGGKVAVSQEHLEAVRKWIRGGAPREGVVTGTQELLGTCLPPPTPLKIPVPDPPGPNVGVQFQQTPWDLPPTTPTSSGEDEICMSTYYDVSALVPEWAKVRCPAEFQVQHSCSNALTTECSSDADCPGGTCTGSLKNFNNPTGECFRYHKQTLLQDPQSHHSIIHLYTGAYGLDHAGWGEWTTKLEPTDPDYALENGAACDPSMVDPALGFNPGCSGAVISSVACGGYGPPDANQFSLTGQGGNLPTFSGSQEPYYQQTLADGVYAVAPLRGVVVWNSHAFNLTQTDSTMAQFLNLEFAQPEDQIYPLQGIFDARWIFAQDVPAFGTQEICATHTIEQGARLFELASHTHARGVRWRTWAPPNTPCQPGCPTPNLPSSPIRLCREDPDLPPCPGPRKDAPLYFSSDYSDPLQLAFDPPRAYDLPDVADRTFLFCSRYDNGSGPGSPPVKLRSQSPYPPDIPGLAPGTLLNLLGLGGPCPMNVTTCADGPNKGVVCGSTSTLDHAFCGDPALELCDACPMRGGVTTSDEMYILLGSYFVPAPEPAAAWLGGAAIAALALQNFRRRRR
jgi:cysteine-rich repeat protein